MGDQSVLQRILNGDEDPMDLPLALLQSITNDFSQERIIGHGGFGQVYKGVLRNGITVAVKRIHPNVNIVDEKLFRRAIDSLMWANHRNVVRLLGSCSITHRTAIKEAESGEIRLAMISERLLCLEYISNGSLDKHITDELRGLEWETRYEIITGICKGLRYLHEEKNIIHLDLKPSNILLDDCMVPKITDSGLSKPNENSHTMGLRFGTRGYLAPEYENNGKTSLKSDIYSLGAIIIELVTGCMGVPDKNNVLRRWRHRWNKPPTLLQYHQVTRCLEIALRCRQKEPKHRPSMSEIFSILTKSEITDGHTGQELLLVAPAVAAELEEAATMDASGTRMAAMWNVGPWRMWLARRRASHGRPMQFHGFKCPHGRQTTHGLLASSTTVVATASHTTNDVVVEESKRIFQGKKMTRWWFCCA